jgi:general nucleoside transport system permease protein
VANEIARRVARRSAERGTAAPVGGIVPGDGGTGVGQSVDPEEANPPAGTGVGVSRTAGAGQTDTDGRGGRA